MADSYLAIAAIANDEFMIERMNAAAAQQRHLGNAPQIVPDAQYWVTVNKYVWASSPGWGEKWSSALASDNPEPGKDEAVITDADILATIQALAGPPSAEE